MYLALKKRKRLKVSRKMIRIVSHCMWVIILYSMVFSFVL
jgi:hypothetical protein